MNRSLLHGVRVAIAADGARSLWRGFSAQLVLCCSMSLYLPLYETLRHAAGAALGGRDRLAWRETAAVTVAAKLGVTLVSHPVTLIKARLQDQRARVGATTYESLAGAAATVLRREGARGFYRGITIGLSQSTARAVCQMLTYEEVLQRVVALRRRVAPVVVSLAVV